MAALEKSKFFKVMETQGLALTYSDVRMETGPSEVAPLEVDITSRFSRNVELKAPILSAAMDTVTTSSMAIAMAKSGGLGIIHAGLTIEEQLHEVRRVKFYLNGLVEQPRTVLESDTLQDVLDMCTAERIDFRTFPVVDTSGAFVGLLTHNDFDLSGTWSAKVGSVMTPAAKVISAQPKTTVKQAFEKMLQLKKKTLPLLNKDGSLAGMYVFSDVSRIVRDHSGQYNVDANGRLRVGAAVPTDQTANERVRALLPYLDVVVIDSAQGDSKYAFETLKSLKKEFPGVDVVVGNVSSAHSARKLAEAGADGIKVGQGPGSICTTRTETGIGCPQVTAVYECVKAINNPDIPVCADGGIEHPGDISLAIAAGASCVMMGNMLAGTKEAPGDIIEMSDGTRMKVYRGMGSPSALRDSAASRARYSTGNVGRPLSEGVEATIAYKGPVDELLDHYIKALRKSMSYIGAKTIVEHQQNTRFYHITNAGIIESRTHGI